MKPLCNLPLPTSRHPISQASFHPTLPLLFLRTSDRATTTLRLRSIEEVKAKRIRRKKREREKGKKTAVEDTNGHEEEDVEVKWEQRLVTWCIVRANAKVKSFALSPSEADTTKGGVPVSHHIRSNPADIFSYFLPLRTTQ